MERDGSPGVVRWSSHRSFVLAAISAVLGLGNVWRFPQLVAEHGGAAFIAIYLLLLLLLGLPLLTAELVLARRMQEPLASGFAAEVRAAQAAPAWHLLPWLTLLAAWSVLAYLGVIGGWLTAYATAALGGAFAEATPRALALRFDALAGDAPASVAWLTLFLGSATWVSALGVRRGLERALPVAFALLGLSAGALFLMLLAGELLGAGLAALAAVDLDAVGWDSVGAALGQAFFTLTLGVGALHAYALRLPPGGSLPRLAARVLLADTGLALLAAVAVLALLAGAAEETASGPRLLFASLPAALGHLRQGGALALPVYLACAVLAWLLALALLEPLVQALDARLRLGRRRAALVAGLAVWLPALLVALAIAAGTLASWPARGPFGWFEALAGRLLVPLTALLLALFVGWVLPEGARRAVLPLVPEAQYRTWRALLRYAVPPLLLLVFLAGAGILPAPR